MFRLPPALAELAALACAAAVFVASALEAPGEPQHEAQPTASIAR